MSRHAQTVLLRDGDLTVEAWSAAHVASIVPWLRPGQEWKRWDAPYLPAPDERQRAAVARAVQADPWQRDARSDRPMRLPVCRDGDAVGTVSWHWEDAGSGWARVGVVLYDPDTWGHGLGTRALRLWSDWLAAAEDVHRLDLATWAGNERMLRAARRVGFADEVRLTGARVVDGTRHDGVVMARVEGG